MNSTLLVISNMPICTAPSNSGWLLCYGVFPQNSHHITVTHTTECQKNTVQIVLAGFLLDDHGRKCEAHPLGCGNAFIEWQGNGVGMLVRLRRAEVTHLVIYNAHDNGTDCCRVFLLHRNTPLVWMHSSWMVPCCVSGKFFFLIQLTGAWEHCITTTAVMRMQRLSEI